MQKINYLTQQFSTRNFKKITECSKKKYSDFYVSFEIYFKTIFFQLNYNIFDL